MTLDPYQLCPCGSGKKVKFCCSRDIVHELERVERMIQGEQRLASLEKLDALLAKYPDRPSLLMMKAEVELALKEWPKAESTIQRLQQVDPQNPSVQALLAILQGIQNGDIQLAVQQLQHAFAVADSVVTARMYEAIMMLSVRLLRQGYPAAAKGHLQLALALSDAKDERCTSLLMQLNQSRSIPLLLREPLDLMPCSDEVTWKIEFQAAMAEVYRGRWLVGVQKLADMSKRILDAVPILQNLAVLNTWLAQNQEAVQAFRALARIRDLPLDDRVHAEALAQLLDRESDAGNIDMLLLTYSLSDIEPLMEQCLSNKKLRQMPVERSESEGDEPPPRALFDVLERPMPSTGKDLQAADVPQSIATLAVYGKQTDRESRLEVLVPRTYDLTEKLQFLRDLAGEQFSEPVSEEVRARIPRLMAEVFGVWRMPDDTDPQRRQQLSRELRQQSVLERWPNVPTPLLQGKTPAEAARAGGFKISLLATLMMLELTAQEGHWQLDTRSLREQLDLPIPDPIDLDPLDLDRLPVHRFSRLDIGRLSDEQLLMAYRRAYTVMSVDSLRRLALEVIQRPSLDDQIDKVEAYDILSDVAETTDEALAYLEKARKLATADGESPAHWLIDELELRLLRGEAEKFLELLKEIQTRYLKEPGVGAALLEVLSRYGLVTPDGRVMMPTTRDVTAAAEIHEGQTAPAPVWTPDAPTPAPPAAGDESEKESKLWLPGMD